ncbi:MAG: hypothetical protein ABGZ35_27020 [Planctomycetaceae bacterium]
MRSITVALVVVITGFMADRVQGQAREFPYPAVVVKDDTLVRSGGNADYYPTQRLQADDLVMVHRHDPGGWLAIEPPKGSFSWIRTRFVNRTAPDTGTVTEDSVIVFVGSEFGEESSVWQRRLSHGAPVTILGEEELETAAGPRKMYKIAPPARERRWISGDTVVPVDEATREQHDRDPFKAPSTTRLVPRRSPVPAVATPAPSSRLKRIHQIRAEQRELAEIDQRFRTMLRGNPTNWDLQSVESDYNELRNNATWRPLAGQIDLRFPAIERYRKRQAEYEDFKRLTSETERRDAELIASQFGSSTQSAEVSNEVPSPLNVAAANPQHSILDMPAASITGPGPRSAEGPPVPGVEDPGPDSPGSLSLPGSVQPGSRYIGAGVVKRLPEGGFVLMSLNGRRLAQLEGHDGVVLEEFIGKPVGLHGKRWYRNDIGSDFIEVTGLEPVRIRR